MTVDRGKIVAIITGVISLLLAIAYLVLVQLLDFRGEMLPAPVSELEGAMGAAPELTSPGSLTGAVCTAPPLMPAYDNWDKAA